jgi:hypothetical protein
MQTTRRGGNLRVRHLIVPAGGAGRIHLDSMRAIELVHFISTPGMCATITGWQLSWPLCTAILCIADMHRHTHKMPAIMAVRWSRRAAAGAAVSSLLRSPAGAPEAGAGYSLTAGQAAGARAYLARLLQAGALGGPALSPGAGGPLAARNISDWLYGASGLLHFSPELTRLPRASAWSGPRMAPASDRKTERAVLTTMPCTALLSEGQNPAGWVDPLLGSSAFGRVGAAPAGRVALGIGWPTADAPMQASPCCRASPSAATEGRSR